MAADHFPLTESSATDDDRDQLALALALAVTRTRNNVQEKTKRLGWNGSKLRFLTNLLQLL
jgi:hypothetical protein